jgi:hypothetical protein
MTADFWDFNIGQVFTILGGIVSLVIVWQKMRDGIDEVKLRVHEHDRELDDIRKMSLRVVVEQHGLRLGKLEESVGSIHEVQADVRWIKQLLEKMDRHARQQSNE